MVSTLLEVLRKGLKTLTDRVKTKEELQARLAERKPISAQDEHWLDHNVNLVDEQWVLEVLESASSAHHASCAVREVSGVDNHPYYILFSYIIIITVLEIHKRA